MVLPSGTDTVRGVRVLTGVGVGQFCGGKKVSGAARVCYGCGAEEKEWR
jgi:hypothetical protein